MNQLGFSSVFFLLVLLINFHGVRIHGAADHDLISAVCKKSVEENQGDVKYGFCLSYLKADPKSKTYGAYDLGVLSYDHVLKKGISIDSHIHKLLKNGKQSPDVMGRLKGCSQDYSNIGTLLEHASESFGGGDNISAGIRLDTAKDIALSCQGRFDGGFTSPLAKEENEFRQYIYISMTLTEMNISV
ncbi:hypothetical protein MKW98_023209 [Papaver atlanticum]|uniref:Pectinesterase inhibitor domain-containing protein n=1 Tax=Papaver atlanticum TaxID=357466 RepID=A0AAD4T9Q2_9MAGN|nr:hypothetical protein MKW98_023209 [Papaver atlanticum]